MHFFSLFVTLVLQDQNIKPHYSPSSFLPSSSASPVASRKFGIMITASLCLCRFIKLYLSDYIYSAFPSPIPTISWCSAFQFHIISHQVNTFFIHVGSFRSRYWQRWGILKRFVTDSRQELEERRNASTAHTGAGSTQGMIGCLVTEM